ncbi:MAG: hydantoinase/oxoprolinase family protein, partial [Deltaproteobacteria bacterium]|nr:hydantoinase/oxoprolinase family protein [Deltaproteobacteria bacterium]
KADMNGVNSALTTLAGTLGTSSREVAQGIVRIANNNMVNALKLVSVNRGHDPRDYTMIAFGGGGAMHACALASELGIKKVIVPKQSAVFSAWGMLMCDIRRDYIQTQIIELGESDAADTINRNLEVLEKEALDAFKQEDIDASQVQFVRYGRFRYQNQEHSVEVELPNGKIETSLIDSISEDFHVTYERAYTYRLESPVDLVSFHLVALAEVGKIEPEELTVSGRKMEDAIKSQREVDYNEAGVCMATIYDGDLLEPGLTFKGPAVVEESGTTVVISPDMPVSIDKYGNIHIQTSSQEG